MKTTTNTLSKILLVTIGFISFASAEYLPAPSAQGVATRAADAGAEGMGAALAIANSTNPVASVLSTQTSAVAYLACLKSATAASETATANIPPIADATNVLAESAQIQTTAMDISKAVLDAKLACHTQFAGQLSTASASAQSESALFTAESLACEASLQSILTSLTEEESKVATWNIALMAGIKQCHSLAASATASFNFALAATYNAAAVSAETAGQAHQSSWQKSITGTQSGVTLAEQQQKALEAAVLAPGSYMNGTQIETLKRTPGMTMDSLNSQISEASSTLMSSHSAVSSQLAICKYTLAPAVPGFMTSPLSVSQAANVQLKKFAEATLLTTYAWSPTPVTTACTTPVTNFSADAAAVGIFQQSCQTTGVSIITNLGGPVTRATAITTFQLAVASAAGQTSLSLAELLKNIAGLASLATNIANLKGSPSSGLSKDKNPEADAVKAVPAIASKDKKNTELTAPETTVSKKSELGEQKNVADSNDQAVNDTIRSGGSFGGNLNIGETSVATIPSEKVSSDTISTASNSSSRLASKPTNNRLAIGTAQSDMAQSENKNGSVASDSLKINSEFSQNSAAVTGAARMPASVNALNTDASLNSDENKMARANIATVSDFKFGNARYMKNSDKKQGNIKKAAASEENKSTSLNPTIQISFSQGDSLFRIIENRYQVSALPILLSK